MFDLSTCHKPRPLCPIVHLRSIWDTLIVASSCTLYLTLLQSWVLCSWASQNLAVSNEIECKFLTFLWSSETWDWTLWPECQVLHLQEPRHYPSIDYPYNETWSWQRHAVGIFFFFGLVNYSLFLFHIILYHKVRNKRYLIILAFNTLT